MDSSLSTEELRFIEYWKASRLKEKRLLNQLLVGLPLGIIFAVPVLLNLFSHWYKRADMLVNSRLSPSIILIAVALIIVFVAIFSKKHKWEMKEQHYLELLTKKSSHGNETIAAKEDN